MENQSTALVPQDPFQVMERLDEDQVLQEMKGRALDALVYEIKQGGETVTGLSLAGVREVARQMNRSGNARIGISDREPTIAETDEYFEVKVYAIDPQNGGGYWGIKRQPKKFNNGKVNQFALEQALAKAQRNALRGLIPETFAKEMIDTFRNRGHGKVVVPPPHHAEVTNAPVASSMPAEEPGYDRAARVEHLKNVRAEIKALGGNPSPLFPSNIESREPLEEEIKETESQLEHLRAYKTATKAPASA